MASRSNVFVGIKPHNEHSTDAIGSSVVENRVDTYDYVLLPLTNNRYRDSMKAKFEEYRDHGHEWNEELKLDPPQLQELGVLPSNGDVSYIGLVSYFLELESHDADVRTLSLQVLEHELRYANFVGIKQVILAPPKKLNTLHYYAQSLSTVFDTFKDTCPAISISLPLFEDSDPLSTWELWNTIRKMCGYQPKLTVSLALPRQKTPRYVLSRWLSEPVTCLLVSASIFTTNQYNHPVLNKFNQQLITEFQRVNGNASKFGELAIVLHGMEKYTDKLNIEPSKYLEYLNYLLKKGDKLILMESPNDLQNEPTIMPPLLPHHENLSNAVYQTFEQDTIKYDLYEKAITAAASEILTKNISRRKNSAEFIALVAGAGRGPLVEKTFKVLNKLGLVNFRLLAIEKNPQAILYLQKRNFDLWNNKVEIIKTDIREWHDDIKVDLCISELLGSFGCNELSPECIAPIEAFHSKPETIFIPQGYSSYAAPISSPVLYQSLVEKGREFLEKPSLVHNIPYCRTSSRVNEIWSFSHLHQQHHQFNKSSISHFRIKHKSEIHGIAGFFIATLYDNITLSIVPNDSIIKTLEEQESSNIDNSRGHNGPTPTKVNHTDSMRSWSPVFFPLNEPLFLNDDTELELFIIRNDLNGRVWYEWSVSSFVYLVSSSKPPRLDGERVPSAESKETTDIETQNMTNAFAKFSPQPDSSEVEDKYFEDSINHTNFISGKGNEWDSVKDLHEIQNRQSSFDGSKDRREPRKISFTEEYHVRVRTDISKLHNPNGCMYSIPL
ncbi:unnamed protein product [Kluyveromyces dobzhanskii CBS 2104]|uniref:WGS project CCBQ000000000 data, contig 00097 n=1 Tax=Kluyveromyces dobzhanskii CBS 2104 TaxID=1427455 RepID=A0A0A8L2L2_9SACH|nr:unnamed protein product [Kluyveromyces dobzhanskii CBS 2104]